MQRRDEHEAEAAAIAGLVWLDGKRVLDVGCGRGRLAAFAAAHAASVYAFDPNAQNVAAARAALTDEQRSRVRVDTQPLSAHPRVATDGAEVGALDMRAWRDTIHAVDERFAETVAAGFYALRHEQRFIVTDSFDGGPECLKTVSNWRDTRVQPSLASRLEATRTAVTVEQEVRLRLLRRARRPVKSLQIKPSDGLEPSTAADRFWPRAVRLIQRDRRSGCRCLSNTK